jgi:hypothetical protein
MIESDNSNDRRKSSINSHLFGEASPLENPAVGIRL